MLSCQLVGKGQKISDAFLTWRKDLICCEPGTITRGNWRNHSFSRLLQDSRMIVHIQKALIDMRRATFASSVVFSASTF